MQLNQQTFNPYLHQFGTGLSILMQLSGSGQSIINNSGVEVHLVQKWSKEWSKRAFVATQSGVYLNQAAFTGGY